MRELLARFGFRASLAVPLLREDRIIGALVVRRNSTGEFPPEVIELLKTFATQSALAIQNARLFREIENKNRQIEAANRHKSEFLANMSHELRTPLTAIIGFSEVLSDKLFGELNDKQNEYIGDIVTSGRHLLSLINDILDLSKVEAGRMELDVTRFDLPTAIENALILIRERATRHGIKVEHYIDERLGEVAGDERKFKQILLNLLSNAVKFTPEGGSIGVSAALIKDAVEVAVRDTGIGIAPENQQTIFEEFRQVGTDAAKKREGTGLGLTLTKKFVELHGGTIRVESAVGRGSTFTFTLPLTKRTLMAQELILIVEDNEKNRKLIRDLLQAKGYQTIESDAAEQGLKLAEERQPALILMDIQLAGMDGISALRQLKASASTRSIPVMAITASAMTYNRESMLAEGFDGYQIKPFNLREFLADIARLIEKRG